MNVITTREGSDGSGRRVCLAIFVLAVSMLAGCGKGGDNANQTADAEVNATLVQLTSDLHHTMVGRKLNRNFDEFVALAHPEVPPPPAGKKYAISEKWKVILVNK